MSSEYRLNLKILNEGASEYYEDTKQFDDDSGVDLYFPDDVTIPSKALGFMVGLGVASELCKTNGSGVEYSAYWILPRSSIAKTPLRLSNSIGLVDKGYRGELKAAIDNHSQHDFQIKRGTRLFQLAHPQLIPMNVSVVDELSVTDRGAGGFGSTGK